MKDTKPECKCDHCVTAERSLDARRRAELSLDRAVKRLEETIDRLNSKLRDKGGMKNGI